jgi:eukaryotic-like serine/threonine-protein kinase
MGVVYKARDPRLNRLVAVKVLAAHLSSSPQARQRFDREAKLVSQLSHPNVCALFDVGHESGTDFLVMELLEGEALADRLGRGSLPFAEVLRHGIEIADALDKAHAAGIVHRDLKPANVMLTKSGVKLLDFGLAKAFEVGAPDQVSAALTASVEASLTLEGAIIGTLQYMAPEQVEGKSADARSDIFALGAVLYEMAAGRRPFPGESRAAIASAILSAEPEALSSIKPQLPVGFTRLVRSCLEKDPDRRWQSAHDVALQLRALADPQPVSGAVTFRRASSWLPWTIAAVAVLAAVLVHSRQTPPSAPAATVRFRVPPPEGRTFLETVEVVPYALSPDGSKLILAARNPDGGTRLWLRTLSSAEARPIEGTEGALTAIWSPDGRSIAFAAGGKLRRLDLASGGPALTLCDVRRNIGIMGSWGSAGQIVFASIEGEAIWSIPSAGGTPVVVVKGDPTKGDARVNWPSFLPDGKRFLYLARDSGDTGHVALGEAGQPPRFVRSGFSPAYYVPPGQIVFVQDGTLLGQRFDAERGVALGEPFPIAEPVNAFTSSGWAAFTVSQNGVLAYASATDRARIAWIDREGRELAPAGSPADLHRLALSRDGQQALFDRTQPGSGTFDLWTLDLARNTESRLTSDPGSEISGAWLPDASAVLFSASRRGPPHLFRKALASGAEDELTPPGRLQFVLDTSPDARLVLYEQRSSRGDMDIMALPLVGPHTPIPVLESAFAETDASFSPDGRVLAYASNESGSFEVYVRGFPGRGPGTRVSNGGGLAPRWSRAGHELFYVDSANRMIAVAIQTAPLLDVGRPAALFTLKGRGWSSYAPAPDGSKFLAILPEAVAIEQPLTVVLNWPAEVREASAP